MNVAVSLLAKASVVMGLWGVAYVLLRRRSAATRHLVSTMAFVSLLVLPVFAWIGPTWRIAIPASAASPMVESAAAAVSVEPAIQAGPLVDAAPAARRVSVGSPADPATAARSSTASWQAVAIAIYLGGVVLLLLHMVAGRISVARLVRRAVEVSDPEWRRLLAESSAGLALDVPVRLLRSREQTMPLAFGIHTRSILLPAIADTWSEDRRRAVLLHELAHVVRRDCLSQAIAALACAFYWVHPGSWWMARRLRIERELACDDRVIGAGATARDYAGHLLDLAYSLGGHRAPALVVTMARPNQLEGRMLAILDERRNRAIPGPQHHLAATAIAAALIVPLASAETTLVPADARYVVEAPAYVGSRVGDSRNPVESGQVASPSREPRPVAPAAVVDPSGHGTDDDSGPGTWDVRPSMKAGYVNLQLRERHSSWGSDLPLQQLEGLSAQQLESGSGPVRFTLRRDAGTFTFTGTLGSGVGAGTYTFAANPSFAGELEKRGVGRPTEKEQYRMARSDISLAFVDELKAQNYTGVTTSELVRAGDHGANLSYLRAMGELGYRVGALDALITLRDHGVSPDYVRELQELGFTKLTADELRTARDHGVTPEYIRQLADLGYKLTIDQLRNARDHGVTPEFVRGMKALAPASVSIDQLVNIRDHGVTPEFARQMSELGLAKVPVEQLVKMRDHGVGPDFVRELATLGYKGLDVETLVRLRDHGVTPDYVRELKDLGYSGLPVDELVMLRDHGVTADRIRKANERAGTKLPAEMLRAVVDGGLR